MREISVVFIAFLYLERMIIMKKTALFTNMIDLARAIETYNREGVKYELTTTKGIGGEELIMVILPEDYLFGLPVKLDAYTDEKLF